MRTWFAGGMATTIAPAPAAPAPRFGVGGEPRPRPLPECVISPSLGIPRPGYSREPSHPPVIGMWVAVLERLSTLVPATLDIDAVDSGGEGNPD